MFNVYEVMVDVVNCLGLFTIRCVVVAESEFLAVNKVRRANIANGNYVAIYVSRTFAEGLTF